MPEYLASTSIPAQTASRACEPSSMKRRPEGYSLHQAIERSPCQWVLIFSSLSCGQCQAT